MNQRNHSNKPKSTNVFGFYKDVRTQIEFLIFLTLTEVSYIYEPLGIQIVITKSYISNLMTIPNYKEIIKAKHCLVVVLNVPSTLGCNSNGTNFFR